MIQKCSLLRVLEVFFTEPTNIHFIKEISKRIDLAPTSVRKNIGFLLKKGLIKRKEAKPFNGFVANRENDDFILYKRLYNVYSLKTLTKFLTEFYFPKAIILFGSASRGEDIETSDIDIVVVSKTKKAVELGTFEKNIQRKIHVIIVDNIDEFDKSIRNKVINGVILYGWI